MQHGTRQTQAITKSNINYNSQALNSFVDIKVKQFNGIVNVNIIISKFKYS